MYIYIRLLFLIRVGESSQILNIYNKLNDLHIINQNDTYNEDDSDDEGNKEVLNIDNDISITLENNVFNLLIILKIDSYKKTIEIFHKQVLCYIISNM